MLPLLGHYLEGPKAIPNLISEWMKNGTVMDYMKVRTFNADEIRGMVSSYPAFVLDKDGLSSSGATGGIGSGLHTYPT